MAFVVPPSVAVIKTHDGLNLMSLDVCSKYGGYTTGGQVSGVVPTAIEICELCLLGFIPLQKAHFTLLILPQRLEHPPRA
ncbi:MAG: hypothetical protein D6778_01985 [Nitrospirae bacterium]|nr:MAG: hypothetical protein D6778_01985 [Nitrospirota bacterium]